MADAYSEAADHFVTELNGLRARAACAILAIHSTNETAVNADGTVRASGLELLELVQHPNYWKRLGYQEPASYDFLFAWYRRGFETRDTAQEIMGWAEMGESCIMVSQAYEMAGKFRSGA